METTVIKINGMTCRHCTSSVEEALGKRAGVESVVADLESGTATVVHDERATEDALRALIEEIGFETA